MVTVHTIFDCKHEREIEVDVDPDTVVPDSVRGLGKCPECMGEANLVPVSGVAPQVGGNQVILDSILMIPV